MDAAWWNSHFTEVARSFSGGRFTTTTNSDRFGAEQVRSGARGMETFGNSGAGAIALAALFGATRIALLGYDLQRTGGKVHWHGDHPAGLGNAGSMSKWPAQFGKLAATLRGIEVINCSRETALTVFPCARLEEVLVP